MFHSNLFSMEPNAFHQFVQLYPNINAAGDIDLPPLVPPESGLIDDAARLGFPVQKVGRAAVVSLTGVLLKNPPRWMASYGINGTRPVAITLDLAVADKSIETIVLRIDSPGGSVDGLAELGDKVFSVRQQKKVIAQVDGMAASAAYYVGSQAHEIYAGRMDMVGSIGARSMLYDFSKMFETEGIRPVPIDTGKFKSAGAMGTKITKEQEADFQRIVDSYFADFLATVLRGRSKLSEKELREVADGRMFLSTEAINLGLIDQVRTMEETLREFVASRSPKNKAMTTQQHGEIEKRKIRLGLL